MSVLLLAGLLNPLCHAAGQLDTLVAKALQDKLAGYFSAIERESAYVKKGECDFLIEAASDSLMRQHVALTAYRHYRDSKVMGDEAVAIYVFDKWFASSLVKMDDEMEFMAAKVFAGFNRHSLIGMDAPRLKMRLPDGGEFRFFEEADSRYRILYFYDTDCASCKIQTVLLRNLLSEKDLPVDLYAIYSDDDHDAWISYAGQDLNFESGNVRTVHLWDPELDSDFQRQYGVLQTPGIFLISPEGVIEGRRLDVPALAVMLDLIFSERKLNYGSEESMRLFSSLFSGGAPEADEVKGIADYIYASTLERGDTVMFRQMTGDMLYYLSSRREEGYKEGMDYLIDRYILSQDKVWASEDDSLKVVGMSLMFDDLLSRSRLGKTVPDIRVPGVMMTAGKSRTGMFNLRKAGGRKSLIMFVTDGCNVCAAEKSAAMDLVSSERGTKVLMVNVDDVLYQSPSLANRLFDTFDLSSLPFIMETDRKGRITRRYVSLVR